ncbi:hypothetical protein GcM1_157006, partial [Golovinomyces cichoracearum]
LVAQCVITVLGSIKAGLGTEKTSSIVWERPSFRPSFSIAEITSSLGNAKRILKEAGFLRENIYGAGMFKYCYDGEHPLLDKTDHRPSVMGSNAEISNKTMTLDPRLRVNKEDDLCEFTKDGEILRVPYKLLNSQNKHECDKALVRHAHWQIANWLKVKDERHTSVYNKDTSKEEYINCLQQWSV